MTDTKTTYAVDEIMATDGFTTATRVLRDTHDRFVDEIIKITEIPSPPFKEEKRARAYERMLRDHGLEDVQQDEIGNVIGLRRGRANGRAVVVAAHLDTVFPEGTDCRVRREGTKLFAPGVGDDTRGLAALLAYIRALDAGDIETEADLVFVGDVGEEGRGDLRGIRHFCTEGAWRDRIEAFFTIDGIAMDSITTVAVGSHRYRVTFKGPGGHSFSAFGTANPAYALGHLLTGMSQIDVPQDPRTTFCAAIIGGGSAINAIPEAVWVDIDLRSEDPAELAALDLQMRALIDSAVVGENARAGAEGGTITYDIAQVGQRPAGRTDQDSLIVQAARAALAAHGFSPEDEASSTDANIPMSLGIPAIRVGSGGKGGRAHSLEEWIDVEPELSSRGLSAGLAAILGTAGVRL